MHAREVQSSDPRDRIYAFMGLMTPSYNIVPSYEASNSISDTLCHKAKRIILHDACLDIIRDASPEYILDGAMLPSWVPQWCSSSDQTRMLDDDYRACPSYPAIVSFHENAEQQPDRILKVAGLIIDQVVADTTVVRSGTGRTGTTLELWADMANLSLAEDSTNAELYFTGERVVEALLSTLYLGRRANEETEDAEVVENNFLATRRHHRCHELNQQRNLRLLVAVADEDHCFFITPKGYMGLSSVILAHTDLIVILFGASVPFVLRRVDDQYTLIGEAYVHGFMNGEAIEMMKRGERETQYMEII